MAPVIHKEINYHQLPPEIPHLYGHKMSNPVVERPTPPETLNRLEVESASTTSLPISFPYLYITEGTNSFDTFNLLNRASSNEGPKYPNTAHINGASSTEPASKITSSGKSPTQAPSPAEEALFNQVPKRFSQFILDQQNPYVSQRLDNLSVVSPSLGSDDPLAKTTKRTFSTNSKKTKISSNSRPSSTPYTPHSYSLSREISNSMGSQATIFSTRQEQEELGPRSHSKRGRRSRMPGARFTRSRSSKVKAQLYAIDSTNSSLERRKAIKFKKGSVLYRIKIRLERFLNKVKALRFHNFKVTSKRPGQARSSSIRRNKSIRFARLVSSGEREPVTISAPSTNPNLGKGGVQKVKELDDALKYSAGAPSENVNVSAVPPQEVGKLNHLSSYIDQQQSDYVSTMRRKSEQSTINYGRNNLLDPKRFEAPNEFNYSGRAESDTGASETAESEAPPPPPHLIDKELTPISDPDIQGDLVELWRRYLASVLCKRIQLRQEINMFQSIVASKALDSFDVAGEVDGDAKDPIAATDIDSHSDYSSNASPSAIYTTTDSEGTADVFVDPPTEEFNKTYLNRRSMLGEMLEYDSDGESDSSSFNTEGSHTSSVAQSDLSVAKTYGTILRKKNPIKNRTQSLSSSSSMSTIRRSGAHQFNLNALAR